MYCVFVQSEELTRSYEAAVTEARQQCERQLSAAQRESSEYAQRLVQAFESKSNSNVNSGAGTFPGRAQQYGAGTMSAAGSRPTSPPGARSGGGAASEMGMPASAAAAKKPGLNDLLQRAASVTPR